MDLQDFFDKYFELQRSMEKTMRVGQALAALKEMPNEYPICVSMEWLEPFNEYFDTSSGRNDEEWRKFAEHKKAEYVGKQMYLTGDFGSDRGDYAKLYLEYTFEPRKFTVEQLIDTLERAKKQGTMEGYKGGTFPIENKTLLTIAEYGFSEGIRPTKFELGDKCVIMHTTYEEAL